MACRRSSRQRSSCSYCPLHPGHLGGPVPPTDAVPVCVIIQGKVGPSIRGAFEHSHADSANALHRVFCGEKNGISQKQKPSLGPLNSAVKSGMVKEPPRAPVDGDLQVVRHQFQLRWGVGNLMNSRVCFLVTTFSTVIATGSFSLRGWTSRQQ